MTGQLPRGPAVFNSAVGPAGSGLASGAVEAWWRTRTGYPWFFTWGALQQTTLGNTLHYGGFI